MAFENTKETLVQISYDLTLEIRKIIRERDHIDTGMLISNIICQAVYNPLRSKTSFEIVYNAPYYWTYVDTMSAKKQGATWNNTCSDALKQSDVYKSSKEKLLKALENDNIDVKKNRNIINDLVGGAIKINNIIKTIKSLI